MSYLNNQLLATGLDQTALNLLKSNAVDPNSTKLFGGVLIGGLAYYSIGNSIKIKGIAHSNANWNVLSTLSGVMIGTLYWNEKMTPKVTLGVVLGCVSLYLMNGID